MFAAADLLKQPSERPPYFAFNGSVDAAFDEQDGIIEALTREIENTGFIAHGILDDKRATAYVSYQPFAHARWAAKDDRPPLSPADFANMQEKRVEEIAPLLPTEEEQRRAEYEAELAQLEKARAGTARKAGERWRGMRSRARYKAKQKKQHLMLTERYGWIVSIFRDSLTNTRISIRLARYDGHVYLNIKKGDLYRQVAVKTESFDIEKLQDSRQVVRNTAQKYRTVFT